MPRRTEPLFDPFLFLTDLGADVRLVGEGDEKQLKISWWKGVPSHKRQKGLKIAKAFDRLLRLQLASTPPSSVQKLLAHGKIAVKNGRFVLLDARPNSPRKEER